MLETVGQTLINFWPILGPQQANCQQTVGQQVFSGSCSSQLPNILNCKFQYKCSMQDSLPIDNWIISFLGIYQFYDLIKKFRVQNLSLRNCYVNDMGAKMIGRALTANKSLTTLNLCYNKISCEGASWIAKVNKDDCVWVKLWFVPKIRGCEV